MCGSVQGRVEGVPRAGGAVGLATAAAAATRARARCVSSDSTTRRDAGVLPWSEVRAKSRVCGKERDRARTACWYASASETASRRKHKRQETKKQPMGKVGSSSSDVGSGCEFHKSLQEATPRDRAKVR